MVVFFVHGMGRTPLSGSVLLWKLRRAGLKTQTMAYSTAWQSFAQVKQRLIQRLLTLAARDEYVVLGHSLGGVLLRDALAALPADCRRPKHVFLLGSPVQASRLAQAWAHHPLYRWLTGDCGQLLASPARMAQVARPIDPTSNLVGTRGLVLTRRFFVGEANDGVVAVREASAAWMPEPIPLPIIHTWLPSSRRVAQRVLATLKAAPAP